MTDRIRRFAQDDRGATAIEYALLAAFLAIAIIGALASIKNSLTATFGNVASALTGS